MAYPQDDSAVLCAICHEPIEKEESAVAARTGEIVDYGDGPLFSVLGHRGVYHVSCFERSVGKESFELEDTSIDDWIQSHAPISQRVAAEATTYDSPADLARAVQSGRIMQSPNVGEKTAAELAALLLEDGALRERPPYLPPDLFHDNHHDQ